MNLLKKLLRGIFYFCVGVKTAFLDFVEWYTSNRSIPRVMRNRASLAVLVLAVAVGGWGIYAAVSNADIEQRREQFPASEAAPSDKTEKPEKEKEDAQPVVATPESEASAESADAQQVAQISSLAAPAPTEPQPTVDALAGATRYEPLTAEQMRLVLKDRAKDYEETSASAPPKAGDIAAWKQINSDVFGWITISNTNINYPVVYHQNTNYYTYRGYYKESSRNGVIWADGDTRFDAKGEITSRNTVLYGHNWTNCWRPVQIGRSSDVMLGQLAAYDNAEFAKANPYIRLATTGGDHVYQVFTVFYARPSQFGYNYADGAVVNQIISTAKSKSIHDFGVTVGASDKILTLSTCTRIMGAGDDQRLVVMAKKIS